MGFKLLPTLITRDFTTATVYLYVLVHIKSQNNSLNYNAIENKE